MGSSDEPLGDVMTDPRALIRPSARACPNGHIIYPARGLSCMVDSGFYWCGKCESTPRYRAMSGKWAMGMYYGPATVAPLEENVSETILQEAQRITDSDRAKAYGNALPDAQRWATIFGALTGLDVQPEHFPLALLAVKLSRISQAPECWHRDSAVDIAGYARVAEKIHDEREAA